MPVKNETLHLWKSCCVKRIKITITAKYLPAYGSRAQLTGLQSSGAKRTKTEQILLPLGNFPRFNILSAGVMNNSKQRDAYNKNPQLQFWLRPKPWYGYSVLPAFTVHHSAFHYRRKEKALSTGQFDLLYPFSVCLTCLPCCCCAVLLNRT